MWRLQSYDRNGMLGVIGDSLYNQISSHVSGSTSLKHKISPMINPYNANASPNTKINSITTNSLADFAFARAPELPATPIANPAANEDSPVANPAAKCACDVYCGIVSFPSNCDICELITIAIMSPYIPKTPAMITGSVFFIAYEGLIKPDTITPLPAFAVPYAEPRAERLIPIKIPT